MRIMNYKERWKELLTPEIVPLLTKIHEYKGEQALFIEAHADELEYLLEVARIQSTEASNKIEGIYTSDDRLKLIALDKTMPRTRNEFEIAGYRDVLNMIHNSYEHIPIKPSVILQLHRDLNKFNSSSMGGKYKINDNVIREEDSQGNQRIRFEPVPAWETPDMINQLCEEYDQIMMDESADPLLIIPMFILDFLCIHPFSDGNGRMSRLLTLLLLYRSGYIVGKYISIEKLIEISKDTYYEALEESSKKWHEGENSYEPFTRYMLGVIVNAYREFSTRVNLLSTGDMSKPERIRRIIKETIGTITKSEIMKKCPDISQVTVQRALADLVASGDIEKIGGGRYTKYIWNWSRGEE
ncbi:MAG: Fic family protein [Lachnospiraceae bacterium]|nr:Fic family protein [Lachnospiraceae bacterium]